MEEEKEEEKEEEDEFMIDAFLHATQLLIVTGLTAGSRLSADIRRQTRLASDTCIRSSDPICFAGLVAVASAAVVAIVTVADGVFITVVAVVAVIFVIAVAVTEICLSCVIGLKSVIEFLLLSSLDWWRLDCEGF